MNSKKIKRLTLGGMLAALTAVFNAYVSLPIAGGYFHPGDAMIALSGVVLGPFAAVPAAIGSCLADLLAGYTIYAPFTFAVKGVMGLIAGWGCASGKINLRSAGALVLGGLTVVGGYFATDTILYGAETALASVPWNALQGAIYIAFGIICLGAGLKKLVYRI